MSNENEKPIVHHICTGYLGWSNWRAGLEFYRGDGGNNRWTPRQSNYGGEQQSGLLLQDDLEKVDGIGEGCPCVVITFGTRDIAVAQRLAAELAAAFEREADAH